MTADRWHLLVAALAGNLHVLEPAAPGPRRVFHGCPDVEPAEPPPEFRRDPALRRWLEQRAQAEVQHVRA